MALRLEADAVRRQALGSRVYVRALLEFSSRCRENCLYCGLRRDNSAVERYALDPDAIVATAIAAARVGYASMVLQSGEDPSYSRALLARIIGRIKDAVPDLTLTLSVGERSRADYLDWRKAGADRYLLKHETADPDLYAFLRPGRRLAARLRRASALRELGYAVGLGNMVGLPGQTEAALEADLDLFRRFGPDMAAVGPFIPHPETPLAGAQAGSAEATLDFLARARLALPATHIPATTALATARADGREAALSAGANVIMVNVGGEAIRARYEIYPGRDDGSRAWGRRHSVPEAFPTAPPTAAAPGDSQVPSLAVQRQRVVAWLRGLGRTADGIDA